MGQHSEGKEEAAGTPSPAAAYFLLDGGNGEEETPHDEYDDEVHMRSISGFGACVRACVHALPLCVYI
jgi:hypothetical protein